MLFVGGPNKSKTNPRWRKAAIFKNRKSVIYLERFNPYLWNLARWRILGLQTGPEVKIHNFWKSKMADGRHKIGHITRTVRPIVAKFSTLTNIWFPNRTESCNFQLLKIHDGGRPPSWKSKIGHRTIFINAKACSCHTPSRQKYNYLLRFIYFTYFTK